MSVHADEKSFILFDENSVKDYIKRRTQIFREDADLEVKEIGDGNINYVFRVSDKEEGTSVVIKQADRLLRSSGRPLDRNRINIEAKTLKQQGKLVPDLVPAVIDFDETMSTIIMEDISEYRNMRKELMQGKTFPFFADRISEYLTEAILPTSDMFLDRKEKKERVKEFTNPDLCDITEDLVFREPYDDYKGRNRISKGMEHFVEEHLYCDEVLKAEVGVLRSIFMNKAETLIHGDLHTGSVFINARGLKVIDPEFAFYGPISYDAGNIVANLFFSKIFLSLMYPSFHEEIERIGVMIEDVFDLCGKKIGEKILKEANCPLYNRFFAESFVRDFLAETAGFAGTELIRRTVGDAKVIEITELADTHIREKAEKILLFLGIRLIKNRIDIKKGKDLTDMYKKAVNEDEI